MRPRLRTIAILMLLAGLSLGVFAAQALGGLPWSGLRIFRAREPSPRVRQYLEQLRQEFQLDEERTRRIADTLDEYDGAVRKKIYELRQQHRAEFRALFDAAQEKIDGILSEVLSERSGGGVERPTPGNR